MTFYTKLLDDKLVLKTANTSPGTGYAVVPDVQTAFNQAMSNGVTLFIAPGTYQTTEIVLNLGGGTIHVSGVRGSSVLQLTSGNNLLNISGGYYAVIEKISLDGNNVTFSNLTSSSALLQIGSTTNLTVSNCILGNSVACGVYAASSSVTIKNCEIDNCSYGIWGLDSRLVVDNNVIRNSANGGIMVWTSTVRGNNSIVSNNTIFTVNSGSGTGQNGNAIYVLRAIAVNIIGNMISGCQYSAIRCAGGGDFIISGNNFYGTRETAIFIESPGSPAQGFDLNGGVVCGNMIDAASCGISVANVGINGQGTARSIVITGNRIANVVRSTITDPGYFPTGATTNTTTAIGIHVEEACVVSGNIIDTCADIGISAGHNGGYDLSITGNLVLNSKIGIGFSTSNVVGQFSITGNQIQGATSGGIIYVGFLDATATYYVPTGAPDYGNQYDAQEGVVFLGNNRSY